MIPATPATIPLTRAQIRRARQPRGAAITQRLARQHAPTWWERLALALALLPHRRPAVLAHLSTFWDTWALSSPSNAGRRATLRRRLAGERTRVLAARRAVQRASRRTSWPQTHAAADARWRAEMRDLLDTLGVVVEAHEDHWGAIHFQARDLARDHRAALTQPSLDALLLDGDEPGASTALTRPHDSTTQPALPIVVL